MPPIAAAFPGTVRDTPRGPRVDREALRRAVLGDDAALCRLERIVHPLVRDAERRFLAAARRRAFRQPRGASGPRFGPRAASRAAGGARRPVSRDSQARSGRLTVESPGGYPPGAHWKGDLAR